MKYSIKIQTRTVLTVVFFFLAYIQQVKTQSIGFENKIWNAHMSNQSGQYFYTVRHVSDTLINGKKYNVIDNQLVFRTAVVRKQGDLVFYYDLFQGRELLMYDWSLKKGDTLQLGQRLQTDRVFFGIVDSTYVVNILGKSRRVQEITTFGQYQGQKITILEDIGFYDKRRRWNTVYVFGIYMGAAIFDVQLAFCTYEEIGVGTFDAKPWLLQKVNCDPLLSVEASQKIGLKIFPNPSQSIINIHGINGASKVQIYNSSGSLVKDLIINENDPSLDISNLPSGLYNTRITDSTGLNTVLKFVKN